MNQDVDEYFWPSYVDLFISLFFIGLVLFVIAFLQKNKAEELISKANLTEENLFNLDSIIQAYEAKIAEYEKAILAETIKKEGYEKIKQIDEDIKQVMSNDFFTYREEINGYLLNVPIKFQAGVDPCGDKGATIPYQYQNKLLEAGQALATVLKALRKKHANVHFMLVVAGRSSITTRDNEILESGDEGKIEGQWRCNYQLSYKRAYSLYHLWRKKGNIDFDGGIYKDYLDLHIAGNGYGGAGRFPRTGISGNYSSQSESRNQGFIVEIIPKVADLILQ